MISGINFFSQNRLKIKENKSLYKMHLKHIGFYLQSLSCTSKLTLLRPLCSTFISELRATFMREFKYLASCCCCFGLWPLLTHQLFWSTSSPFSFVSIILLSPHGTVVATLSSHHSYSSSFSPLPHLPQWFCLPPP